MGSGDLCELQEDRGGNLTEERSCVLCDLGKSLSYSTLLTCTPKTHGLSSKNSGRNNKNLSSVGFTDSDSKELPASPHSSPWVPSLAAAVVGTVTDVTFNARDPAHSRCEQHGLPRGPPSLTAAICSLRDVCELPEELARGLASQCLWLKMPLGPLRNAKTRLALVPKAAEHSNAKTLRPQARIQETPTENCKK